MLQFWGSTGNGQEGRQTLIDKLEAESPRKAPYTPAFRRLVELSEKPEWRDRVWRPGGNYDRRGDFREISDGDYPLILHQGNRRSRTAGDKIELVETGPMALYEMATRLQSVVKAEALDMRVMRLDLASDVPGVPVEFFRTHTYVRSKRVMREWLLQSLSSNGAETITAGNKPNQLRFYDKTGHRKVLLAEETRRIPKSDRAVFAQTFEQRWGYNPRKIVTRVERQIGGKTPIERFGYTKIGNLYQLDKVDPFTQIVFPEEREFSLAEQTKGLRPEQRIMAQYLHNLAERDGMTNAKNHLRRMCKTKTEYYRLLDRYEAHMMAKKTAVGATRETVMASYLTSINRQLLRAA